MEISTFYFLEQRRVAGEEVDLLPIAEMRKSLEAFYTELKREPEDTLEGLDDLTSIKDKNEFIKDYEKVRIGLRSQFNLSEGEVTSKFFNVTKRYLVDTGVIDSNSPLDFQKAILIASGHVIRRSVKRGYFATFLKWLSEEQIEKLIEFSCSFSEPTYAEMFTEWQSGNSIEFLARENRDEIKKEIETYFGMYSDEKFEEDAMLSIIMRVRRWTGGFHELLESTRNMVESFRNFGVALQDLTYVNYALGEQEVILDEEDD